MIYREEALKDGYPTCNIEECEIVYKGEIDSLIDSTRYRYLKLNGGRTTTDDGITRKVDGVLVVSTPPYALFIPYNIKKIDDGSEIITLEPIENYFSQSLSSIDNWLYVIASLDQIEKALRRKENSNEQ